MKTESLRIVIEWLREVQALLAVGEVEAAQAEVQALHDDLITLALEQQ